MFASNLIITGRIGNTVLAIWFVVMSIVFVGIAFFAGPFYPRFSGPEKKPIPYWRVRPFLVLGALWFAYMAYWMWRHR